MHYDARPPIPGADVDRYSIAASASDASLRAPGCLFRAEITLVNSALASSFRSSCSRAIVDDVGVVRAALEGGVECLEGVAGFAEQEERIAPPVQRPRGEDAALRVLGWEAILDRREQCVADAEQGFRARCGCLWIAQAFLHLVEQRGEGRHHIEGAPGAGMLAERLGARFHLAARREFIDLRRREQRDRPRFRDDFFRRLGRFAAREEDVFADESGVLRRHLRTR
jgi:hypothetical protein